MTTRRTTELVVGLGLTLLLILGGFLLLRERAGPPSKATSGVGAGTTNEAGPTGPGPGLVIRNLRAAPSNDPGRQRVLYDIVWPTALFPGIYRCTWTAFAGTQQVGEFSDLVAALSPVEAVPVEIPVANRATSFSANCGDRLDVGTPYAYEISETKISSTRLASQSIGVARVSYEAHWLGPNQAGPASCTWTFFDGAGSQIFSTSRTLYAVDGNVSFGESAFNVEATEFAEVQPVTVSASCVPFRG